MQKIDEAHSLLRNVSWAKLRKDEDHNVVGVNVDAFRRPEDHEGLSCTWTEFFPGGRQAQVVSAVHATRRCITVGKKSGYVIGNVGGIKVAASKYGHKIRVVHDPVDGNDAHAEVRRMPVEDLELFEVLATEYWCELIFDVDIPPE